MRSAVFALFALLPGRSKLGAHRDPFAGSIRYHLGLKTPNSDDCRIYIDGEPYAWRDGQAIMFDETFIHKVRNDTDEVRIILFCDVTRPLKTPIARWINKIMIRYVVKASQTQNEAGEKVGPLNYISRYIFALRENYEKQMKGHRLRTRIIQTALLLAAVGSVSALARRCG